MQVNRNLFCAQGSNNNNNNNNNIAKTTTQPKAIYRFKAIPIKNPMSFFTGLKQIILNIVLNQKKILDSQSNPEKKNKAGGITFYFQPYYKGIVIKIIWCFIC